MKTKKIVWGLLITMIMIGCSTDDTEIIEEQVQLKAKFGNTIDQINDQDTFDGSGDDIVHDISLGLGMPVETHDLSEDGIIKIRYYTNNSNTRFNIRKEFHEKYPSLVLVLSLSPGSYDPNIEYWFLGEVDGISIHENIYEDTNAQSGNEVDSELTGQDLPRKISLFDIVKADISDHPLISLISYPY